MGAVARYLFTLREGRKLSQKQVGAAVGVSDRQVANWEKGENQPKIGYVPALLGVLQGAYEDLAQLLAENVPEEEGVTLAQKRLATSEPDPLEEVLREVQVTGARPADSEAFNEFLNLVAAGVSPQDAARRALQQP
ncbi:helix-turn-helix transcriptional regulator [Chloroflexales bacterium ZM16-3]|nr:helix-turn-helix transcriptional regulator [Chloroflexales bacterium ZM16-3]